MMLSKNMVTEKDSWMHLEFLYAHGLVLHNYKGLKGRKLKIL